MTRNLNRRSIEAVPDAATAHDLHPAAGSARELAVRAQRIVDDLAVLSRELLVLGDHPAERQPLSTYEPTLLTVEVAARYLMVSRTVIFGLIKSGVLDSVQIGKARRVPRAACDSYVAELMSARRSA